MAGLLGHHFETVVFPDSELSTRGQTLIRRWAHKIFESPDKPRSREARAGGKDKPAHSIFDIHAKRFELHFGQDQMAAWLGYTTPDVMTRALTDARSQGLVDSWYAPGDNHPTNRLVVPALARLALETTQQQILQLASDDLTPLSALGDTPELAVAGLEAAVRALTPRLGNREYPTWTRSDSAVAGLMATEAKRAYVLEALPPLLPAAPTTPAESAQVSSFAARTEANATRARKAAGPSQDDRVLAMLEDAA